MYSVEGKEGEVKIACTVEELASHDVHIHIVAGICAIDNISIRNCQISEVYG
jgi:hypothetical protein